MTIAERIQELFQRRGTEAYFGENVSQLEHALQAAFFAERANASPALVLAALLHDVGHLIHGMPEDIADHGIDAHHEAAGAAWLSEFYGPEVTEPIRLHVDAKRYLCFADARYRGELSPASIQSLALQGGPYDAAQARVFESNPFFQEAISLRRWDEAAKVEALQVPPLEHYRSLIASLAV